MDAIRRKFGNAASSASNVSSSITNAAPSASNFASTTPGRIQVPLPVPRAAVGEALKAQETQKGASSSTGQARTEPPTPGDKAK